MISKIEMMKIMLLMILFVSMLNQSLAATKRKLEQETDNLKQDTDDMRGNS